MSHSYPQKTWINGRFTRSHFEKPTINRVLVLLGVFFKYHFAIKIFKYSSEVTSGRLSWSPVHTNNRFWRENAQRLVEKDYKLLRKLTHILETDQNTEVRLDVFK